MVRLPWRKRPDREQLVRNAAAGSQEEQRRALAELTSQLVDSSEVLEWLTFWLALLTVALIGATIALVVTQA
jgi:hypothetical protein